MPGHKSTTVTIAQGQLAGTVEVYANLGFIITNMSEQSATLKKEKKLNLKLLFLPAGGLYLLSYFRQPSAEVIEIKIDAQLGGRPPS